MKKNIGLKQLVLLFGLLVLSISFLNFSADVKNVYLQLPCESLTEGSRKIYLFTHANQKRYQDLYVASHRNNLLQVIMISKEDVNSASYTQKTTYNYITSPASTYLSDFTFEFPSSPHMTMKYKFSKPQPSCGKIPIHWIDSIIYDSNIGGSQMTVDLPPQEVTTSFLSKEVIQVPAGKFETSVFEKKTKWTDGNGSSVTMVALMYIAENVGLVKEIIVRIQKAHIIEIAKSKEIEDLIAKGISDIQQGKKMSDIDLFKDTNTHNVQEIPTFKFKTYKSISTRELVSVANK